MDQNVRKTNDSYAILRQTMLDDSFLLRLGFSEEEMEEFLTASLAKEMAGRLPAYCRQADGRFDSVRVSEIAEEYVRDLRRKPPQGWPRYVMDYMLAELFPESQERDRSQDEPFREGRLLFLQILRSCYRYEEETLPYDPRRDVFMLPDEMAYGRTFAEYKRLKDLVDYGYVYEFMRVASDITPFDTLAHMSGVHYVATYMARQLSLAGVEVDLALISGAAIGHDIGKFGCRPQEARRVPYLHYYYTDLCYKRYGLEQMGHIAANHSTWDLELEDLSVESLLLIYADFRVRSERDERGHETVHIYSLADAFSVILSKLDNVDSAKEKRYRKVYAKLRDFEDYMIEHGATPVLPEKPTPRIPTPQPVKRERVLLTGSEVTQQLKYTAIDHNIRLTRILHVDSDLADLIEAARSEEAWKNVRTYIGIIAEYSTYMTENQKLMTLRFLYELLAHKDGDIREQAAQVLGEMIAGFSIRFKKELPEGVRLPRTEDRNLELAAEYLDRILYPERRFTEQHRQWMQASLSSFMEALLAACPPEAKKEYTDLLVPYYGAGEIDAELAVVLLTLLEHLPEEAVSDRLGDVAAELADACSGTEDTALSIAALRAQKQLAGGMQEDLYYARLAGIMGLSPQPEDWKDNQGILFLDDLKMGTHGLIKIASIEMMLYYSRTLSDPGNTIQLGTHLVNLLKVNARLDVRKAAGNALLALIPQMTNAQRNELAVELYNGLEVGERQYAKYVPYYLGKMTLSLPAAELDEMIDTLEVAILHTGPKVASFMIESIGVMLEHFADFEDRYPEKEVANRARKIRMLYLMIKAYAHYDDQFSREAFRCIGQYVFASPVMKKRDKKLLFTHSHKKLLMLLDERKEETLRFYSNAAVLNHIYRFISACEQDGEGLKFQKKEAVCFYPGTFDPFSLGHKAVACKIRDFGFEVYLAVDEFSWSKHTQPKLLRRAIVNMSTGGEEDIYTFPDEIPVNIANPDDIRRLKELFAGRDLYLAVGSDVVEHASAYALPPDEDTVHSLNHIIFDRETREERGEEELTGISPIRGDVIRLTLDKFYEDISSSRIRENIDLNRDISNLIDSTAQGFIYENNMYLREPTYKHVLEARELYISDLEAARLEDVRTMLAKAGGRTLDALGSYLGGERVKTVKICDLTQDGEIIAFAACRKIETKRLLNEVRDPALAARIRSRAFGDIAAIGFLYADDRRVTDAAQMIITELLTGLIAKDYAYAIYVPVDGTRDPVMEEALIRQGFTDIAEEGEPGPLYAVDMKAPVIVFKDVETVIKAPLNKNRRVLEAMEEAHGRLLSVMADIYPGRLLLSFNTSAIQSKIISKMAELNGVSTIEGKSARGPYMAVPFGKALGDVLVPNTVTKTLAVEKFFNRDVSGFSIAEAPNHSPLETQASMIASFRRPVVLIDDLLHKSHRMNKLSPILAGSGVEIKEVLVGVMTGNAMDRMSAAGLRAESAYFLPTLELWLNERDCYPYIGGDSLEGASGNIPTGDKPAGGSVRAASANLMLPYIRPGFIKGRGEEAIYNYSLVCLENACMILRVLEEEYQKEFGRKLTLKRLGEVVTIPRIPAVDRGVHFDENLEPTVFLKNDLEKLSRLKWGAVE